MSDNSAFQFRSGRMANNRPQSLADWRVTTGDPDVAKAVAQLMGGTPQEWETSKDDFLEVLTTTDSVQVVIDGPKAIKALAILWGQSGPIHECNGVEFLSPDKDKGKPCGCPALLADRKAAARSGRGPQPNTTVSFRLAEDYHLGVGKFTSTSWDFVGALPEVQDALDAVGGEALCTLSLELLQFTTSTGQNVQYRKPVVKVLGPASAELRTRRFERVTMSYSMTFTEEAARVRDGLAEGERARLMDGLRNLSAAPFLGGSSAVNGDVASRRVTLAERFNVTYGVFAARQMVAVLDVEPVAA
jgi:hypothetical protein